MAAPMLYPAARHHLCCTPACSAALPRSADHSSGAGVTGAALTAAAFRRAAVQQGRLLLPAALPWAAARCGLPHNRISVACAATSSSGSSGDGGSNSSSSGGSNSSSGADAPRSPQVSLLRITGDGRCLFRSLAQGAHLAMQEDAASSGSSSDSSSGQAERLQLLAPQQETAMADDLRAAVCSELLKRRGELCFFIDEDYDAYVRRMQQPHVWGGEPELAVATHVLQRPISVYSPASRQLALVSCYGEEQYAGRADVPLLFHGGGHYDLLVRQPPAAATPRSRL